jgi:hypothetical protein
MVLKAIRSQVAQFPLCPFSKALVAALPEGKSSVKEIRLGYYQPKTDGRSVGWRIDPQDAWNFYASRYGLGGSLTKVIGYFETWKADGWPSAAILSPVWHKLWEIDYRSPTSSPLPSEVTQLRWGLESVEVDPTEETGEEIPLLSSSDVLDHVTSGRSLVGAKVKIV